MEKITFQLNENDKVEYYVLEQTKLAGETYLLVTDTEEGDGEALILRQISGTEDGEFGYTDDLTDEEMDAVVPIFENLLDDVEFI